MSLQVEMVEENSIHCFKIVGEIDAYTAPVLKERLAAVELKEGMEVQIDLSAVEYMDSTGLGIFVGFYKTAKAEGSYMKITGVNSRLKRLFDITGLAEVMDIEAEESGDKDATL